MRINRQTLLKITNETVKKRVRESHSILAVYMYGSLAQEEEPFLGDSTDIDLVFIHEFDNGKKREIIGLTEEITLDIENHSRTDYRAPRELRSHPWLGPAIYKFTILHDPRHFLDFAQASLRDQFFAPDNVLARAQAFTASARQAWMSLLSAGNSSPETVEKFLQAAADSANGFASLEGDPMPERRLLTQFFERTQTMGQPALYSGLLEILGAGEMSAEDLSQCLSAWDIAYSAACSVTNTAPEAWAVLPVRKRYYRNAYEAQMQSERPADALWNLLLTWTRAVSYLADNHSAHKDWSAMMTQIGLLGQNFADKLEALDSYLDLLEETLEGWGLARGITEF